MQVTDGNIMLAGTAGGFAALTVGGGLGIAGAGRRYAAADEHVRRYTNTDRGPRSAAEAKYLASAAKRGAAAVTQPSVPFNINAPGMRSADAIATGAKRGALAGAAIFAAAAIATQFLGD